MKLKSLFALSFVPLLFGLASCSKPSGPVTTADQIKEAKTVLTGDVVVNAHAYMKGNLLTGLPTGAPMKYTFSWKGDDALHLALNEFAVANMPLQLFFNIDLNVIPRNKWEREEMEGNDWIKFYGDNGVTTFKSINPKVPALDDGNGGKVTMYYNVKTRQIELSLDFNTQTITTEVPLQVVDPSRAARYEEELLKYAEEFAKWKAEQGRP